MTANTTPPLAPVPTPTGRRASRRGAAGRPGGFAAALLLAWSLHLGVAAQAEPRFNFSLPALPLREALLTLSQQAGYQLILVDLAHLFERPVPAIRGEMPLDEALTRVLAGTGATYEHSGERTLIVRPADPEVPPPAKASSRRPLEELVVTARRPVRPPEDLGTAVTLFDAGELKTFAITRPEHLAAHTPALTVKNALITTNPIFTLRGVGHNSFTSNMSPAVGVYIDDVFFGSASLLTLDLFDVERIEVLKGPQGALFGRNTIGGVINIRNRRPATAPEAELSAELGNFDYRAFRGAVSGPLAPHWAGRLAVSARRLQDGFYHNRSSGNDYGAVDVTSWRASLSGQFAPAWDVYISLYGLRDRSEQWLYDTLGISDPDRPQQHPQLGTLYPEPCPAWHADDLSGVRANCVNLRGYRDADGDPFAGDFSREPVIRADTVGGIAHLDWQHERWQWKWVSGYQDFDKQLQEDFDGSPFIIGDNDFRDRIRTLYQEVRGRYTASDSLTALAGLYAGREVIRAESLTGARERWGTDLLVRYRQRSHSGAVFTHLEWDPAGPWRASAGLRYNREQIDFYGATVNTDPLGLGTVNIFSLPVDPGVVVAVDEQLDSDNGSGSLGIDYRIDPAWLWYATLNRSHKSGGFTGYWLIRPEDATPYGQETITALETGLKWRPPSRNLGGSLALYHYDHRDQQQFVVSSLETFRIVNAADVVSEGLELEFDWRPAPQLSLSAGLGYIHARYHRVAAEAADAREGHEPVNTPHWSFTGAGSYRWHLTDTLALTLNVDTHYQSRVFLTAANRDTEAQRAYWLVNASLGLNAPGELWSLHLWGRNLGDERYVVESLSSASSTTLVRAVGEPRTYGLTLSYHWQ